MPAACAEHELPNLLLFVFEASTQPDLIWESLARGYAAGNWLVQCCCNQFGCEVQQKADMTVVAFHCHRYSEA